MGIWLIVIGVMEVVAAVRRSAGRPNTLEQRTSQLTKKLPLGWWRRSVVYYTSVVGNPTGSQGMVHMDALDVSRWQFGITTVYHFIFVPLTIGLAPLIAVMQTAWVITGNAAWYRLTKFFGKLFLINFAIGVATGIVQEFQFGMNWSEYSRFVGDVFGAPLAMEALVAFFFESTFIGLWIFGWTRLPRLVHLACIWIVAIAVNVSAFFIIAANSWMQHPVGARFNPETGRAELTSIVALFTNNTATAAFSHAIAGAFLTAGTFVAGVCAWWLVRSRRAGTGDDDARDDVPAGHHPRLPRHARRGGRTVPHRRRPGQADVPAAADEDGVGGIVVPHRDRPRLLDPHRRHPQQLRRRRPRHRGALRLPSSPRAGSTGSRWRASRTCRRSTRPRTAPATTDPTSS